MVILYTACIKCIAVHFYTYLVSSGPIVQDKDFYAHERIKVVWWTVALWADKYGRNSMETFLVLCQIKHGCPFVNNVIRQINESSNARLWSADRSRRMLSSSAVVESCIFRSSGRGSRVVNSNSIISYFFDIADGSLHLTCLSSGFDTQLFGYHQVCWTDFSESLRKTKINYQWLSIIRYAEQTQRVPNKNRN